MHVAEIWQYPVKSRGGERLVRATPRPRGVSGDRSRPSSDRATLAREHLRRCYRPTKVRLLFVGEAPPASGRFFYQADSGLYRAIRDAFVKARPELRQADFLESFRDLGCYLVDLCGRPVDRLDVKARRQACLEGEPRLSRMLRALRPDAVITVVRSIAPNVRRAQHLASWTGPHFELPYPGRWKDHRIEFERQLVPMLRKNLPRVS